MKAILASLSLLASLANLFTVARGQPEELPAIEKISGAEVNIKRSRIIILVSGGFFLFLKAYCENKVVFESFDLCGLHGLRNFGSQSNIISLHFG